MNRRELLRILRRDGWSVSVTGSGHFRCVHPSAAHPVILSATPRIKDSGKMDLARIRRALRKQEERRP